jgi:hypothetical protein
LKDKILSTKTTSAIFLAIVLVTGTISLSYPSFMIIGAAQAQPYYGIDSYGLTDYGNDNGYDKSQYQSYKPDYNKPKYSSYVKDNYKLQKDSTIINKINCINSNNI